MMDVKKMTMNFLIEEFESKPLFNINDETVKIKLDWVTHGNFAIHTDDDYLSLEVQHFKEILDSFRDAPKPSKRIPFWKGDIPARGMRLGNLVEAYACNDKYIKLIKSTCTDLMGPQVPTY